MISDNSRLPTQLPREVLSQLDPRLAELYSQLFPALASRVSSLVTGALPQRIHADRALKFAFLYANAEQRIRGEAVSKAISKDHTRRSKLELAGEIHGFLTGYDDEEAAQRYRRGRRARQQIKASLDALLVRWRAFDQVVRKHRSELPIHITVFERESARGWENIPEHGNRHRPRRRRLDARTGSRARTFGDSPSLYFVALEDGAVPG